MAQVSLDFILRGKYEGGGVKALRQGMEELRRREFDAGHSARERELRDVDEHYSKMRAMRERQSKGLAGAEESARAEFQKLRAGRTFRPDEIKQEEVDKARARLKSFTDAQANVNALTTQAEQTERAERATLQKRWAEEDAATSASLDRRTFDATHSAREREIRDTQAHFARLRGEHSGNAAMLKKIKLTEIAEIDALEKRHRQETMQRMLSQRGLRLMMGGAATAAGLQIMSAEMGFIHAQRDLESARARGDVGGILGARAAKQEAVGGAVGWVPIAGAPLKNVLGEIFHTREFGELRKDAEATDSRISGLRKALQDSAVHADHLRAGLLGLTAAEQARAQAQRESLGRAETLRGAQATAGEARFQVVRGAELGLGGADLMAFDARARAAERYARQLEEVTKQEDEYASRAAARASRMEEINFRYAMEDRLTAARGRNVLGMAGQQQFEMQGLLRGQERELNNPEAQGLMQRLREMEDPQAWQRTWWERERAAGRNVTDVDAQQAFEKERKEADAALKRHQEIQRIQREERTAMGAKQEREREEARRSLDVRGELAELRGQGRSEAEQRARVQMRESQRAETIGFGYAPGSEDAKRLTELHRTELLNQEQDFQRARAESAKQWARERADAETSADETISGARRRELENLRRQFEDERKVEGDRAELREMYAAKVAAANQKYDRLQRESQVGLLGGALRAAGKTREADLLQTRESYAQQREKFADNPDMLKLLGAMQGRDEAAIRARGVAMPHEAQSVSSRFLHRTPGFEDPQQQQTEELRKANALLQQIVAAMTRGGVTLVPVTLGRGPNG